MERLNVLLLLINFYIWENIGIMLNIETKFDSIIFKPFQDLLAHRFKAQKYTSKFIVFLEKAAEKLTGHPNTRTALMNREATHETEGKGDET